MFGSKEKIKFNNYLGFWLNEKAFIAGAAMTAVVTMTGAYLANSMLVQIEQIFAPLLASIFTASALGHSLGVSTEKEGKVVYSFGTGFFLALSTVLIAYFQFSLLSGIVASMAIAVFLIHNSGMVVQNKRIDKLVELFAWKLSLSGLVAIGLYYYIYPIATNLMVFLMYDMQLVRFFS